MSGAYVAKPDAIITLDDPTGWNGNWPYPGYYPPGFNPDGYTWPGLDPVEVNDPNGDPIPRIRVYPITGIIVHEDDDGVATGNVGTYFFVSLTASPKLGSITVPFTSSDATKGTTSPSSYTFTDTSWHTPRKVLVIGKNDEFIGGDSPWSITVGPATSLSATYNGMTGSSVSITTKEEVNKVLVTGLSVSTTVGYSGGEEDYCVVGVTVYETAASVTSLETAVTTGTVVAERFAQYHHDGTISYIGDDTPYPGTIPLAIEATGLDELHKYWVVTSIDLIGPVGTSTASCGCRMYFHHDDVELEDFFASGTHTGTFGKKAYKCWAILDNTSDDILTKLNKVVSTYDYDYTQELATTVTNDPVLWSYGGTTGEGDARILLEVPDSYRGWWTRYLGKSLASEDTVHKRFWIWTRAFEWGVWAYTTVGVINTDSTIGEAIGGWDALSTWTTTPNTGDASQSTYWLVQLLQSPRASADSTSLTKPLTGTVTYRASSCAGTITSVFTTAVLTDYPGYPGSWYFVKRTMSGSIYDSLTDETTVISATIFPDWTYGTSTIAAAGGTLTVVQAIDTSSSASEDVISLGADNIKTWDYYQA